MHPGYAQILAQGLLHFFALVVKWYNKSMVRTNRQFDSVLEHHTSLYLPLTSESLGFSFFAALADVVIATD